MSGWIDIKEIIWRIEMDIELIIGIAKMIFLAIIGIPLFCVCVCIAAIALVLMILSVGIVLVQIFGGGE